MAARRLGTGINFPAPSFRAFFFPSLVFFLSFTLDKLRKVEAVRGVGYNRNLSSQYFLLLLLLLLLLFLFFNIHIK